MPRWCKGECKNMAEPGYISSQCLSCKWEYVGQEPFDWKGDNFKPINKDSVHPKDTLGDAIRFIGVPWI